MSNKDLGKLSEMVTRGTDYREEYEFEYLNEPVVAILRPLEDGEFLPIAGKLQDKFDIDEEEAVEEIEDAKMEDGGVDVSDMDEEFVELVQKAAKLGIVGDEMENEDGDPMTQDEVDAMVEGMIGGYSIELGGKVLELSGNVRDAEKFRGRGAQ